MLYNSSLALPGLLNQINPSIREQLLSSLRDLDMTLAVGANENTVIRKMQAAIDSARAHNTERQFMVELELI